MKLLRMIGRIFNRPRMERRFRAATSNRLIDWALSPVKVNAELKTDYLSMTLRARDLAKNNEFVAGYLDNLKRNVLGAHGFTLQSKAEPAELARKVEALWMEYQSRSGAFVTLDELQSGRDFDLLILRTLAIDGEVFIRRVFDPVSPYGWRYEVLDSLEIDPFYNEELSDGGRIVMGIRFDARGRERSFFLRHSKTTDHYFCGERIEIPASNVIHIFRKFFPDQARGYTPLAGIILNLAQMDAYKEAEIVHARIQACFMGIWEWNGQNTGDFLDATDDKGEFVREIKSGIFPVAPKGYSAKFLQNTSPNNQFGTFWKTILRSVSNALGMSYNKAAGDYENINYSSVREASLEDRANFEEMQQFMIENWKNSQFRFFVRALALNGKISGAEAAECMKHKFFGRRFAWIDPQKEINAKREEMNLLLTDPITELEMRGLDPVEVIARWARWRGMCAEQGVPFMEQPSALLPPEEEEKTETEGTLKNE